MTNSFSCQKCGHCCHGRGGIIVGKKDLSRLTDYFKLDAKSFLEKYTENFNQKPCLIVKEDNYCYFFNSEVGCTIHIARPDVCRAWPYFRGNLIDKISFEMAKLDCKGINPEMEHEDFALAGYLYLQENSLLGSDPKVDGRALIVSKEELPKKK